MLYYLEICSKLTVIIIGMNLNKIHPIPVT